MPPPWSWGPRRLRSFLGEEGLAGHGCPLSDTPTSVMRVVRMGTPMVFVTSWVSQQSARERGEGACGTETSMGCSPQLGLSSALHEGSGATWRGKQTQAETKCLRRRPDGRTACSRPGLRASQAQGGSVDWELSRELSLFIPRDSHKWTRLLSTQRMLPGSSPARCSSVTPRAEPGKQFTKRADVPLPGRHLKCFHPSRSPDRPHGHLVAQLA